MNLPLDVIRGTYDTYNNLYNEIRFYCKGSHIRELEDAWEVYNSHSLQFIDKHFDEYAQIERLSLYIIIYVRDLFEDRRVLATLQSGKVSLLHVKQGEPYIDVEYKNLFYVDWHANDDTRRIYSKLTDDEKLLLILL